MTQDREIAKAIQGELHRQRTHVELIASENFVSPAVLEALGSPLTNKYAEGYPGKRYYGGCEFVDQVEEIARTRLTQLFSCNFANVQPHSGSQANQAVMLALLQPGETILGMKLEAGGHLTHGSPVNLSGKWFNAISYGVDPETHLIDFAEVARLAEQHRPKIIVAGGSAYPRHIDFARFREIADSVGAFLWVDMAHFAGLVAAGVHPSPFPHAHVVTSTTHKTLRGARGGVILTNDESLAKKINSAIFPGLQGGPLMNVIAAKAIAFGEALLPSFKAYAEQILKNMQAMAEIFRQRGFPLISGGTDTHLILVNVAAKGISGKEAEALLGQRLITCNKNSIPYDTASPMVTSGIRLGTPAVTTRGFVEEDVILVATIICDLLESAATGKEVQKDSEILQQINHLSEKYPLYENMGYL